MWDKTFQSLTEAMLRFFHFPLFNFQLNEENSLINFVSDTFVPLFVFLLFSIDHRLCACSMWNQLSCEVVLISNTACGFIDLGFVSFRLIVIRQNSTASSTIMGQKTNKKLQVRTENSCEKNLICWVSQCVNENLGFFNKKWYGKAISTSKKRTASIDNRLL